MDAWLTALAAQTTPAVLVTVAHTEGSVPRLAGSRMLVSAETQFDTIGGGHLEFCAIALAREMLAGAVEQQRERYALGPSLGQCCGGVVHLAFELYRPGQGDRIAALLRDAQARREQWPRLMLFGAGHVGAALVRALADLPCHVTWVDTRDAPFPAQLVANVTIESTDTPQALIAAAAPGTSFLVMTHSHALDLTLSEQILQRPVGDWFGLIGSHSKRSAFERRLRERGIDTARLAAMACPIGLAGISGKEPAVIAASVCAQLLQVWDKRYSERKS